MRNFSEETGQEGSYTEEEIRKDDKIGDIDTFVPAKDGRCYGVSGRKRISPILIGRTIIGSVQGTLRQDIIIRHRIDTICRRIIPNEDVPS